MFEYIFDYQQRLVLEDKLNLKELTLLFYLAKKILFAEPQMQFRDFTYRDIISDVPILDLESKQLGRLINRLYSLNYIKLVKSFGSFSIALTKKYYNILSPRHINDKEVKHYFFISNWSSMTKFEKKDKANWTSMTNSGNILNNISSNTDNNIYMNNNIEIVVVSNRSSNIYNNNDFITFYSMFDNLKIDCQFDTEKYNLSLLTQKVKQSRFLKKFRSLRELLDKYDLIIQDKYIDFNLEEQPKEEQEDLFDDLDSIQIN